MDVVRTMVLEYSSSTFFGTYVRSTYTSTIVMRWCTNGTGVRTIAIVWHADIAIPCMVPWYHGTRWYVPLVHHTMVLKSPTCTTNGTHYLIGTINGAYVQYVPYGTYHMVPWYSSTMVHTCTYTCTYVRGTRVPWYTCTRVYVRMSRALVDLAIEAVV